MASKEPIGYKWLIIFLFLLLLGSAYSMEYGIVINSGTMRSNIYLYEWPEEKENGTGIVREIRNCRVAGDGISEMKVDQQKDEALWFAFLNCLDDVAEAIPAEKQKYTPLFLGATAGMRLLEVKNKTRANEIMDSFRYFLSAMPFNFQDAAIISGQEEALYGWITVNYLMGKFLQKNMWNKYSRPDGERTVGSLDMGSTSTQIAFAVADNFTGEDYLQVQLFGHSYNVHTCSFLCYGKFEAEKKVLDKIIQHSSRPDHILNPCYPNGLSLTLRAADIYDTACTKIPENYTFDQEFFMVGTGDSDKCKEFVRMIFDSDKFNREEQPVVGEFLGYSGFFFTTRAIGGKEDLDTFNASITTFCNTPWEQLKKEKYWISDRYLRTYCSAGHYTFLLLTEGYEFDKDSWRNLHFDKEKKQTSIEWSLGYMLSLTNSIPSEAEENDYYD